MTFSQTRQHKLMQAQRFFRTQIQILLRLFFYFGYLSNQQIIMAKAMKEIGVQVSITETGVQHNSTTDSLALTFHRELIWSYKLESQALYLYYYRLEDVRGIRSTLLT